MIGRVRSGHDDGHAARARHAYHASRRLTHAQEAHLGEVVEVVLEDHGQRRPVRVERRRPLLFGSGEHRVKEGHRYPISAKRRRGIQRT